MAEDDIYHNKAKYDRFVERIDGLAIPIPERQHSRGHLKYWCKNPDNLGYFRALIPIFEASDLSYVRRKRLFSSLLLICHATTSKLSKCSRVDVNAIVAFGHSALAAAKSKRDFVKDIKRLWRLLLPERDEQGRPDETVVPYAVRHLSAKIDKSRERLRNDRLTVDEVERLLQAFSSDKRLQAFLALSLESLRRPQELLFVRIRDVELHDSYAKVWISSHGKEGPGLAQCIDSYPYLAVWLNEHPLRHDPDAFLFISLGGRRYRQLNPATINKHLREKLAVLGIPKRVTCYSFKRNGVTLRRLRGDSDVSIQRAAGWSSTRQLRTYDLSDAEDALKMELVRRGLLQDPQYARFQPSSRKCHFCGEVNGLASALCARCKRPLERKQIEQAVEEQEQLKQQLSALQADFSRINAFMNRLLEQNPDLLDDMARRAVKQRLEQSAHPGSTNTIKERTHALPNGRAHRRKYGERPAHVV